MTPTTNERLAAYRHQIDYLDIRIINLLRDRIDLSETITEFKQDNDLPVYDSDREIEVMGLYSRELGQTGRVVAAELLNHRMKRLRNEGR